MRLVFLYLMQVILSWKRNRRLHSFLTSDMKVIGDFGCGHFANKYANVLVDQFCSFDEQRGGLKLKQQQPGKVCHDVNLNEFPYPFEDNEFDVLICSHVLEHLDDPAKACEEFSRIAKAGYIEVPHGTVDILIPNNSIIHKWLCYYDETSAVLSFADRKESVRVFQPCNLNIFVRFIMQLQSISLFWNGHIRADYIDTQRKSPSHPK